jgi:hypothetical protein
MLPVATAASGFPDVCLVPSADGPKPTPFPNLGLVSEARLTVSSVRVANATVVEEIAQLCGKANEHAWLRNRHAGKGGAIARSDAR